jgi:hypothetical protein
MIYLGSGSNDWVAGLWVLLGSAIGAIASVGTTYLTDHLRHRRAEKLDQMRERALRARFNASTKDWVPMEKLRDCIGADRDTTVRHLLMIGARRSMKENDVWGLRDWPDPKN